MNAEVSAAFRPIADALREMAKTDPKTPATMVPTGRWGSGFRTATFAQLDARSEAIAAGLATVGLTTGKKAALLVPPTEDFFAIAFALLKGGVVPVLIDPGIGTHALKTCLEEAAPDAFIGIAKAHLARWLLGWCPGAATSIAVGGFFPGVRYGLASLERAGAQRIAANTWQAPSITPDSLAAVLFTSGSTGIPKGVEYLHRQFSAQAEMIRATYDIHPGERNVATFPPFALFGPALKMTTIVPRMDPTRPAKAKPENILAAVNAVSATMMFGSPALLDTVGRWGERTGGKLPGIRRVLSAGAPVSPKIIRRVLKMLPEGAEIFTPYGATESLPVANISSREILALAEERTGICVGRPVAGIEVAVIRISDDAIAEVGPGDVLPIGEVGEIVVAGPNVTERYYAREQATALAKTTWNGRTAHRMGDLGWFDANGRLWFAGRKAHRVITRTRTLFSVPVEEVFNAVPGVNRTALVGLGPKESGAQGLTLCVELEPSLGARDSAQVQKALTLAAENDTLDTGASLIPPSFRFDLRFPVDIRHNSKINRELLATMVRQTTRMDPPA